MNRLAAAMLAATLALVPPGSSARAPVQARESSKAARVASILQSRRFYFMPQFSGPASQQDVCEGLFVALRRASPAVQYPEPVLRTDDPANPVFDRYRLCSRYGDEAAGEPGYFRDLGEEIGSRAFRVYRLDLDGDASDGKEELIYGEAPHRPDAAYSGYYLISVDPARGCLYRRAVPMNARGSADRHTSEDVNAIVRYRKRYFTYELRTLSGDRAAGAPYWLEVHKLSGPVRAPDRTDVSAYCIWDTIGAR